MRSAPTSSAAIALRERASPPPRRYRSGGETGLVGAISPLGRVPLLRVGDAVMSAVIVEYLEEIAARRRSGRPAGARRASFLIEFGSIAVLADIAGLYTAPSSASSARCWRCANASPGWRPAWRRPVVRRRPVRPGRRGVRAGVPLLRRFRPHRRLRDPGRPDGIARWCSILGTRRSVQDAVGQDYASVVRLPRTAARTSRR